MAEVSAAPLKREVMDVHNMTVYSHDFQCILENLAPTNPQGVVDTDMTITPLRQRACLISIQKYMQ